MRKNRTFLFIACLIICLAIAFTFVITILEAEHRCEGEHCHICMEIMACKTALGAAFIVSSCLMVFLLSDRSAQSGRGASGLAVMKETPVSLRVRLKN